MADDIKVIIETILEDKKFKEGVNGIQTHSKKTSKILGGLKSMLMGLGVAFSAVAIIRGFKNIIKTGKEFEQAIANVASVSGDAKDELAKLAREAGMNTVFSAKQAADSMYFLASAGLKLKDMTKVLTPTLNLAAAAQMDIAKATDMVVTQLKVFRAKMSDAEKFTDIMAKTVASANTDMNQLGDALSYAGSIAAQNGMKFEDLNAVIATMADQGIKGARAGVQLRMAFTRLIKPTTEAQKILSKYGITQEEINAVLHDPIKLFKLLEPATKNAAEATAIFGVRQQNVIGIIKSGIPRLVELRKKIEDSGGAAKRMADIQLDTLESKLKLLRSAWVEQSIALTEKFSPAMKKGVEFVTKLIKPEKKLDEVTKELIKASREYANITKTLADESANLTEQEKRKLEVRRAELKLKTFKILSTINQKYKEQKKEVKDLTKSLKYATIIREKQENKVIKNARIIELVERKLAKGKKLSTKQQKMYNDAQTFMLYQAANINALAIDQTKLEIKLSDAKKKLISTYKTLGIAIDEEWLTKGQLIQIDEELINKSKDLYEVIGKETDALEDNTDALKDNTDAAGEAGDEKEKIVLENTGTIINAYKRELAELQNNDEYHAKSVALRAKYGAEIVALVQNYGQQAFDIIGQFQAAETERLAQKHTDEMAMLDERHLAELNKAGGINEQLEALEDDARTKRLADLQAELDAAILAGDTELAKEKENAIKSINLNQEKDTLLEAQAKEKDKLEKQHAVEAAKIKRQSAISEKVASLFGIAANTALGIMKAVAFSPLTAGQPWAGVITGMGIAQGIAAAAKPLPTIPSFKKGTIKTKAGLSELHDDERIIPKHLNIPNISNEDLMRSAMAGMSIGSGRQGTINNTDNRVTNQRSMSLSGANITIRSDDPDDMLEKLENKANSMGKSLF